MENSEWEKLEDEIENCKECPKMNRRGRSENCPGRGNRESPIVLVGQSLCRLGMETKTPFAGSSGVLLDRIFEQSEIKNRDNVFITNLVKCHPPANRSSTTTEKNNCIAYLIREIQLIHPKLIVSLGKDATVAFLGRVSFGEAVNNCFKGEDFILAPVYHPAYYLHSNDKRGLATWGKRLRGLLNEYWEEI